MRDDVEDCLAIGQKLGDGDERVYAATSLPPSLGRTLTRQLFSVLFVKPKGDDLTPEIVERIRAAIRTALSTRHVPARIVFCPKIPYTGNGKRLEVG
jgi:acetoacetyl-CoA synthetase